MTALKRLAIGKERYGDTARESSGCDNLPALLATTPNCSLRGRASVAVPAYESGLAAVAKCGQAGNIFDTDHGEPLDGGARLWRHIRMQLPFALLLALCSCSLFATDWPGWRGPADDGST